MLGSNAAVQDYLGTGSQNAQGQSASTDLNTNSGMTQMGETVAGDGNATFMGTSNPQAASVEGGFEYTSEGMSTSGQLEGNWQDEGSDLSMAMDGANIAQSNAKHTDAEQSTTGQLDRNPYAVWTTGQSQSGTIQSTPLDANGQWTTDDFRDHHEDRSRSWAANRIRNDQNQDLQAYDFTFEQTDDQGQAINGSAHGLDLISPMDAKVLDIQRTYQGSGDLGCFVVLEFTDTGKRVSIHHMDSVTELAKGQVISGGTVIGTQGAAGTTRNQYPTHVDIVGTSEGVEDFVRANQSGKFKTQIANQSKDKEAQGDSASTQSN